MVIELSTYANQVQYCRTGQKICYEIVLRIGLIERPLSSSLEQTFLLNIKYIS